ncbi:hypothetical protein BKA69DRAFT_1171289 [Paraphysoderma sedebokerense]|nr:hypothetical protein BKA69DRAFT_1171289 [Paraphysoderma sedebokerense]
MYGHLQVKLEQLSSRHCDDPYYSSVKPLGDRKLKMSYDISNNVLPVETDCKGIEVEMHVGQTSGFQSNRGRNACTVIFKLNLNSSVRDNGPGIDDPYYSSVKPLGDRKMTMLNDFLSNILPIVTHFKAIEVEIHPRQTTGPYYSSVKPLGDRKLTMPYDFSSKVLPVETDFKAIEVEMHLGQTTGSVKPLGDRKLKMSYDISNNVLPVETDCKGIEVEMHVGQTSG